MIGSDPIALAPIALDGDESTIYNPPSRIMSGGTFTAPNQIPILGVDLLWDNGDEIGYDDGSQIGTETI